MKVREEALVHSEGTMQTIETVGFTVDLASMPQVMKAMRDLYSDLDAAVYRECSSNALDSHKAAGINDPIEVNTASVMNGAMTIIDHGVGLSLDDIRNHYSKFGYSSKRDTNDQVGMLGFGCKAPLTYTHQFTIIAVKDGLKVIALITKGESGVGEIQILDTVPTAERNGVELQIPIHNVNQFNQKATRFFSFWEPGTVLLNGKQPESIFDNEKTLKITDDMMVFPGSHGYGSADGALDQDYVIMGNIAYPAERRISEGVLARHFVCVTRVPIGAIEFTPSREALQYTKHTINTLAERKKFLNANILNHIHKVVDAQPTRWEGAIEAEKWRGTLANSSFIKYRGQDIPLQIPMVGWDFTSNMADVRASKSERIHLSYLTNESKKVVLIRDHPASRPDQRTKDYMFKHYPNHTVFCINGDLIHTTEDRSGQVQRVNGVIQPWPTITKDYEPWVEGCIQVKYPDVHPKLTRQKRDPNTPKVERVRREVMNEHGTFVETNDLLTGTILYLLRNDPGESNIMSPYTREAYRTSVGRIVRATDPTTTVVIVRKPDLERFLKDHPNAMTFLNWLTFQMKTLEDQMSNDTLVWGVGHHELRSYDASTINDPMVKKIIERLQLCCDEQATKLWKIRDELIKSAYNTARYTLPKREAKSDLPEQIKKWAETYPLAQVRIHMKTEVVEYINALFTYRKQAK